MVQVLPSAFVEEFNRVADEVYQTVVNKGFWSCDGGAIEDDLTKVMLVVTELGEMAEGIRHGNPSSDHIPEFSAAEEEAADAVIRLMDLCKRRKWRLAEAIEAKMAYNAVRPWMHGKLA